MQRHFYHRPGYPRRTDNEARRPRQHCRRRYYYSGRAAGTFFTMKILALVHPGLELLAQQEIGELLNLPSHLAPRTVEAEISAPDFPFLLQHGQSFQRLLLPIARLSQLQPISLEALPWSKLITPTIKYMVDIEHITGVEVRQSLVRQLSQELIAQVQKTLHLTPRLDMKNPDIVLLVHFTGKEYIIGLYLIGKKLHKRADRVFPHQASFTGDIA